MTKVLRLDVEYDGAKFYGWAAQPGLRTVEGVFTDALRGVLARDASAPPWRDARTRACTPRPRS